MLLRLRSANLAPVKDELVISNYDLINGVLMRFPAGTRDEAKLYTEAYVAVIKEYLHLGYHVNIREFGKFKVVQCAARQAFNPYKKEKILIPPTKRLRFYPSDTLVFDSPVTQSPAT